MRAFLAVFTVAGTVAFFLYWKMCPDMLAQQATNVVVLYFGQQIVLKAKNGKAVVPVRRNACGGCYKKVPPQTILELRKNSKVMTCEHCGRILVSDEIANNSVVA